MKDDLGVPAVLARRPERVVSLVPSLTETVLASGGSLAGVTDWCAEPAALVAGLPRIGGTKNPSVPAVLDLRPDLVLANFEENRTADLDAIRAAGVPVWVTAPTTVPHALTSLGRLLAVLGLVEGARGWYRPAVRAWPVAVPPPRATALTLIWRRPWMALGRDTFAGDALARLGVANVLAGHEERYPRVAPEEWRGQVDLVVLPSEPYEFGPADLGAFAGWNTPLAFVSGRHLTWYGPSLADAVPTLTRQLAETVTPPA